MKPKNSITAYMLMKKNGKPFSDISGVVIVSKQKREVETWLEEKRGEYIQEVTISW
jgi:hypothetical protein